jgi:hypothetical protein
MGRGRRAARPGAVRGRGPRVQRRSQGGAGQWSRDGARRKEKKLTGRAGMSEEREGRRSC